jgi:maltose/moltooligosaccharide transporter
MSAPVPSSNGKVFHVGTLTYTKAGLFSLFTWLLWGDFCFMLMEVAAPALLQVSLSEMGAPSWLPGLVLSTVPGVVT